MIGFFVKKIWIGSLYLAIMRFFPWTFYLYEGKRFMYGNRSLTIPIWKLFTLFSDTSMLILTKIYSLIKERITSVWAIKIFYKYNFKDSIWLLCDDDILIPWRIYLQKARRYLQGDKFLKKVNLKKIQEKKTTFR